MVIAYEITRGARFRICAVGSSDSGKVHIPYFDFLKEVTTTAPHERAKLIFLLDYTKDFGPPRDEQKCRSLAGHEGLFEFKTRGGLRVFWFYDEDRLIVCTTGFVKKKQKTPAEEISKAEGWRAAYREAKHAGQLKHLQP